MICSISHLRVPLNYCIFSIAILVFVMADAANIPASELRRTAIVRVIQSSRDSVVNIHGHKTVRAKTGSSREVNGMGTGVIVDSRGYIITNYHVVEDVTPIEVTLNNKNTYKARVIVYDKKLDLAVIKIETGKPLPVIKLGTSADIMTGESVIAIGNAYGYQHTVTRGIVSAQNRTVQISENNEYTNLIQTDASINPGNSGGPLLNIDGEMIGINVAVRAGAQGIGFAIPVNKALSISADLLSRRRLNRTWHGLVTTSKTNKKTIEVLVQKINPDSPASKSKLKVGDKITSINGRTIRNRLDVELALIGRRTGEQIDIKIARNSIPMKLSMVLNQQQKIVQPDKSWEMLGLKLSTIKSSIVQRINRNYRGGLKIVEVRKNSPAWQQGIRSGDILVGMHQWETISLENVQYVLNRPDIGQFSPIKFYILRGRDTLFGHLPVAYRAKK